MYHWLIPSGTLPHSFSIPLPSPSCMRHACNFHYRPSLPFSTPYFPSITHRLNPLPRPHSCPIYTHHGLTPQKEIGVYPYNTSSVLSSLQGPLHPQIHINAHPPLCPSAPYALPVPKLDLSRPIFYPSFLSSLSTQPPHFHGKLRRPILFPLPFPACFLDLIQTQFFQPPTFLLRCQTQATPYATLASDPPSILSVPPTRGTERGKTHVARKH